MKYLLSISIFLLAFASQGQVLQENMQFESSPSLPYGAPNPSSPEEILDFKEMIGTCDCKSVTRTTNQEWSDTTSMIWKFKYIMNGTAVQDEVWRNGNLYAGGIRQFHEDSASWVVSYFSNPGISWQPGVWHGNRQNDTINLYRAQKSPTGLEGFYKIQFLNLREYGFDWKGSWVDQNETFEYPTWLIFCEKRPQ